ncbi:SubName: Full=Uncharacterized protein {ECO:0000313/EMBL:CCA73426.1} [Serendipita indica DSM 11827]|nr:SubName: Full=Uncharacterized protein {ECO:0000313/EMBL:CCA73426.1} [Serendipita indica DSM 11827]
MAMPVRESNATIRRQRSKPHLSNHPLHFTLSTPGLILQPEAPQWSPWASDVSLTPASIMSEDSVLSKDNQIIWNSMIGTDTPATSIESPAPSRLNVSIPEALTPIIEATPASVPAVAVARQDLDIDSLLLALAPGTIPLGGRQRDKIQHAYCICISSQWLRNHEHEPRDGCGRSIFLLFLAPTGAGKIVLWPISGVISNIVHSLALESAEMSIASNDFTVQPTFEVTSNDQRSPASYVAPSWSRLLFGGIQQVVDEI